MQVFSNIPSPALPGAGSVSMISARNFKAPQLEIAAKLIQYALPNQERQVKKCIFFFDRIRTFLRLS